MQHVCPGLDPSGRELCHLSWVEFVDGQLSAASHRWFLPDASVAYEQTLFQSSKSTVMPC